LTDTSTVDNLLHTLQKQGMERLPAQLLLLHVLGRSPTDRAWLLTHGDDLIEAVQVQRLMALAARYAAGEPLAYLTGHQAFFGLDLQVDGRVLVPRPDTETLVTWALEILRLEATNDKPQHALDLGTGSGAIALALKATLPALAMHAVDLSADALAVAHANAERLHLPVVFGQGAWFDALPDADMRFDCIVSNPPYIADQDPHLTALTHEPLQALASGTDGLADVRQIIVQAPQWLTVNGWLLLEHGYNQAAAVRDLLTQAGFDQVQSRRDLAGIERCSGGQFAPKRP
jgi:release factor glutamine methyltransferase